MHHTGVHHSAALFVLLVIMPVVLLSFHLLAAVRIRCTTRWSAWHIASFTAGTVLIVVSVLPPFADSAHHDLRGHMIKHLFLGLFGPRGLVFGAPRSLLMRSVPAKMTCVIMNILRTRPVRFLIHPFTAAFLDIGGMYLIYLTPLFGLTMTSPFLFVFVHVHFVLSGYLFT
jgi:putative membrane protein